MSNVMILRYNNYYNRIKKKQSNLDDYVSAVEKKSTYSNVNFYKADGIETSLILNNSNLLRGPLPQSDLPCEEADYLIEFEGSSVLSRWFIMEAMQTRSGQYKVSLKRDVIADNWDAVMSATSYIEKANVNPNDIAIFNSEDIDFNRIKKSEDLLREDPSLPPWIVGYYKAPMNDVNINVPDIGVNSIEVSTLEGWEYYQYQTNNYRQLVDFKASILAYFFVPSSLTTRALHYKKTYNTDGTDSIELVNGNISYPTRLENNSTNFENSFGVFINEESNLIESEILNTNPNYKTDDISKLDGRYLRVTTGSGSGLYQISVIPVGSVVTDSLAFVSSSNTSTRVNSIIQRFDHAESSSGSTSNVIGKFTYQNMRISLSRVSEDASLDFVIKADENDLSDAPYRMFAIPYGKSVIRIGTETKVCGEKTSALAISRALCTALSGLLIDLQILPYCPLREAVNDGIVSYSGSYCTLIGNRPETYILFPKYSTFSFNLSKTISIPDDSIGRKISIQCDSYRICSPNYSAIFEFNPVKTGNISDFSIDCTYKPFSPYIHIQPNWGSLYGKDFDDARGLILQGDFSMAMSSDRWIEYQLNNKNYQNSFNRQIESIELANKYGKTSDILNAAAGTVQGGMTGAMIGSSGGPFGALAGAAVGTVTSLAGGLMDISVNEKLRNESLDLSRDQFNFSLQNIMALPNTISKISSFDANNKIFPILEYYSCTDEEKEIFRNKLKYNGMKVMRIGRISEFITNDQSFVKATLIRIDIPGDNHMVMNIAAEMNGGMYI